ncbi:MAG: hypothetical protein KH338_09315 [Oscillospiraceae bacterium]|nr:hypothetical protein [Clostridiales bacterium]MBS6533811.1 hypothetical protein [Oscillospiraceae bacterium]
MDRRAQEWYTEQAREAAGMEAGMRQAYILGVLEAIIHGDHLKPKEIVEKQRYFLAEVSNFESNLREDG